MTAELERAARPADPTGVLERVSRRRSRRAALRKVQAGLLAFAVLAATIGGFSILTRLFDPNRRVTLAVTPFGAEGAIVTCGDDTGGQICRIDADALSRGATSQDLVRLTDFTGTLVSEPAVSADGTTVVFERHPPITGTSSLWTVRTDGARLRRLAPSEGGLADPSWSPEGTIVAVADEGGPDGTGPAELAIIDPGAATDPVIERIQLPGLTFPSAPSFSPDGTQILFVAGEDPNSAGADVYTIKTDGSNLTDLTRTPRSEWTAAWSPDGQRIAFGFASPSGEELFTCPLDCSNPRRLEDPSGVAIYGALPAWSPDGKWLAFEVVEEDQDSAIHIARLDGGEVRTLASPASGFAWIPVHEVNSPEPSSGPEQAGQDIGMGFPVCQVSELAAQFDGEGATDTAFVATRLGNDMRCPSDVQRAEAFVGIDVDQDGLVDAVHGPIACEVYYCRAFAAPDLDGDDGKRELLVVESRGSVVGLGVYALAPEAGSPGNTEVVRIHIGEPDLVQTGFVTGEPARLFIGGDEGWSYRLRCEDHGVNRFIYQQRAFRPVDSTDPATVDETTLIYWQGRLDVFDAQEPEQSTSDDPLGPQPEEVCGAAIPKV